MHIDVKTLIKGFQRPAASALHSCRAYRCGRIRGYRTTVRSERASLIPQVEGWMDDLGIKALYYATQLCNNSSRCKALKTTQYDLKTSRIYLKKQFKALIQGIPPFWVTNSRDNLPKNMPKNCPLMHSFKISELINSKFQILVMEIFHQVSDPALSPRPFFFSKVLEFQNSKFQNKEFH